MRIGLLTGGGDALAIAEVLQRHGLPTIGVPKTRLRKRERASIAQVDRHCLTRVKRSQGNAGPPRVGAAFRRRPSSGAAARRW